MTDIVDELVDLEPSGESGETTSSDSEPSEQFVREITGDDASGVQESEETSEQEQAEQAEDAEEQETAEEPESDDTPEDQGKAYFQRRFQEEKVRREKLEAQAALTSADNKLREMQPKTKPGEEPGEGDDDSVEAMIERGVQRAVAPLLQQQHQNEINAAADDFGQFCKDNGIDDAARDMALSELNELMPNNTGTTGQRLKMVKRFAQAYNAEIGVKTAEKRGEQKAKQRVYAKLNQTAPASAEVPVRKKAEKSQEEKEIDAGLAAIGALSSDEDILSHLDITS